MDTENCSLDRLEKKRFFVRRVWIARLHPKPRKAMFQETIEADSPEELLRKPLKIKHRAWFELEKVEMSKKTSLGKTSLEGLKEFSSTQKHRY